MSKMLGGIQFFFVRYGLSPENRFPTALRQCWKTYLWLISKQVPFPISRLYDRLSHPYIVCVQWVPRAATYIQID